MQQVNIYDEHSSGLMFTLYYTPKIENIGRDKLIWIFPDGYYKVISMSRNGDSINVEPYILDDMHIKTPLQLLAHI